MSGRDPIDVQGIRDTLMEACWTPDDVAAFDAFVARAVAAEAALAEANEELSAANAAIEAWKDARETWVAEANQQARDLADALFNHGYGPGQCTCERCAALDRHTQADK